MRLCVGVVLAALGWAGCSSIGLPGDNIRGCALPSEESVGTSDDGFLLLALGDFGDGATGRNLEVAETLRRHLEDGNLRPDATLLLGDNFYPRGLIGARTACVPWRSKAPDRAIVEQLAAVVAPFSFLRERSITWAIPGNHDHGCPRLRSLENQGHIDDWLAPADRWGDRWRSMSGLPVAVVDTPLLQVVAFDSTSMIESAQVLAASIERLEALLDASPARWKLVAAHHPLYANGHHDGAWFSGALAKTLYLPSHLLLVPPILYGYEGLYEWPYRRYRRALEEVFARRHVDAFLGGHEHALELLRPPRDGQPYTVISGAAARCAKIMKRDNVIFGASKNGFALLRASADSLDVEFVGTTSCDRRARCGRPKNPGPGYVLFHHQLTKGVRPKEDIRSTSSVSNRRPVGPNRISESVQRPRRRLTAAAGAQ